MASLEEIDTHYDLADLMDAHIALDLQAEANTKAQRASTTRPGRRR